MRLYLAPMEGVMSAPMRQLITGIGDYDLCVTEFIRVVDRLLPRAVFYRMAPELANGGKTQSGTPVRVQLLGQDPNCLADNAARAMALGSPGIDLNFGCPAKTVNKSNGGAVLLKTPERLYQIVSAVRSTTPVEQPLSVKMRLGYYDTSLMLENSDAICQAGATELIVHARTKEDGYKPPAYWHHLAAIQQQVTIPVIANGEIWSKQDAIRCCEQSGCSDLMLGRGALALPNLASVIKSGAEPMPWATLIGLLIAHANVEMTIEKKQYYPNRVKQWLKYLGLHYIQAQALFNQIRRLRCSAQILDLIRSQSI